MDLKQISQLGKWCICCRGIRKLNFGRIVAPFSVFLFFFCFIILKKIKLYLPDENIMPKFNQRKHVIRHVNT